MRRLIFLLLVLVSISGCFHEETVQPAVQPVVIEQPNTPVEEPVVQPQAVPGLEGEVEEMIVTEEGEVVEILIKGFSFGPSVTTVKKGTTVKWTNLDTAAHTATGDNFDSGNLKLGESWSYTFNEIGEFGYICALHPTMKGKLVVEE